MDKISDCFKDFIFRLVIVILMVITRINSLFDRQGSSRGKE
jgi:hypothetical protein